VAKSSFKPNINNKSLIILLYIFGYILNVEIWLFLLFFSHFRQLTLSESTSLLNLWVLISFGQTLTLTKGCSQLVFLKNLLEFFNFFINSIWDVCVCVCVCVCKFDLFFQCFGKISQIFNIKKLKKMIKTYSP
jgi:hypothetical protein